MAADRGQSRLRGSSVVHAGKSTKIINHRATFDHVAIDSPPALSHIRQEIAASSDLAIIPIAPSSLDIWSSRETIQLVTDVGRKNRGLATRLLVYRKISGMRLAAEARDALNSYGLEIFKSEISQRIASVDAIVSADMSLLLFGLSAGYFFGRFIKII